MLRADGRSVSSLRPVDITLEFLDRVDGSAAFAFGKTKALASVSGPIQVRLATELPSKALFEVIMRPLSGIPGTESKALGTTLRTLLAPSLVLTQNPRTLIQLVVQSLTPFQNKPGPSLTAACINASTLALLRASSFPMLGVVCAVAVGRVKESVVIGEDGDSVLLMDPTQEEVQQCSATGCVAVMFGSSGSGANLQRMDDNVGEQGEIVWSSFQGAPLQADYDALVRLAKSGAHAVYTDIRQRLSMETIIFGQDTDEKYAKKIPKHKGGRVALNTGAEDAMDTT